MVSIFLSEYYYYFLISSHDCISQKHEGLFVSSNDCIGTICGTHVTARVPRSHSLKHLEEGDTTPARMRSQVHNVLHGWEGPAHDASILACNMSRANGTNM
jgi:hypothetical protein